MSQRFTSEAVKHNILHSRDKR